MTRPLDQSEADFQEKSLFEQWMGMPLEDWDALGDEDDVAAEQPSLA